jgi:hypothetical protein
MDANSQAYRDAWARVRAAIKTEIVDKNMEYRKGWHRGWLIPASDQAADAMLDDLACMATHAAFGIDVLPSPATQRGEL